LTLNYFGIVTAGLGMLLFLPQIIKQLERRWTLSLACLISAAGLVIAAQGVGTVWAVVGMSIAAMGFYAAKGPF
jgi:ACS family tartrate transporter-like MFS transporter